MKIGAQFFTIRDYCRTPEALDESLKRVADIGYRHIQLSGVCPYEADWMAERLRTYGLSVEITHFDYNRILRDPTGTIRFHDVMGCRWIGIGSNPRGVNPEGLAAMAAEIKPVLPALIAGGHRFMYHNHHMEFARFDGKTFLDLLCEISVGIFYRNHIERAGRTATATSARATGSGIIVQLVDLIEAHQGIFQRFCGIICLIR